MTERETLTIHGADKGWHRIEIDGENRFVSTVKIAGNTVDIHHGRIDVQVEKDNYAISGEYDPWLLIEVAEWYTEPDDD